MFQTHPDFEHWRVRTAVEWQGRHRPIIARLAMWPDSDAVMLLCSFEDDDATGEWAIRVNHSLYPLFPLQRPGKFLQRVHLFDIATRQPRLTFRPRPTQTRRLRNLLHTTWRERRVMRLFHLPDLPASPRVVSEGNGGLLWNDHGVLESCSPFSIGLDDQPLTLDATEIQTRLQSEWKQLDSDARFAWKWGQLRYEDRWSLLLDIEDWQSQLDRVMQLVLLSCNRLWQCGDSPHWRWDLNIRSGHSNFRGFARNPPKTADIAQMWGSFLHQRYLSHLRHDLIERHQCVRRFTEQKNLSPIVCGVQTPTAHEQLEAKLQLRDWLRDKATEQQIKDLLGH